MTENSNDRTMGAVAYLLGFVSGVFLLLTEKKSQFIRFHAMQSAIVFGALTVALAIPFVGQSIVPLISVVLWLFLMWKAYNGEMYKLPTIGDFAAEQLKKMDEQQGGSTQQPPNDSQPPTTT